MKIFYLIASKNIINSNTSRKAISEMIQIIFKRMEQNSVQSNPHRIIRTIQLLQTEEEGKIPSMKSIENIEKTNSMIVDASKN